MQILHRRGLGVVSGYGLGVWYRRKADILKFVSNWCRNPQQRWHGSTASQKSWTAKLRVAHTTSAGVTYPSERRRPGLAGVAGCSPARQTSPNLQASESASMADSEHQTLVAVTQVARRASTQERKRMLQQAHSSAYEAPPAHRQRGSDCSTISVPTKSGGSDQG